MIMIIKINNMGNLNHNNNNNIMLNSLHLFKNNNIDHLQELMINLMDIINLLIKQISHLFNQLNKQLIINNKVILEIINKPYNNHNNNNTTILLMISQLKKEIINLI